jgi:hypothetical protein
MLYSKIDELQTEPHRLIVYFWKTGYLSKQLKAIIR